MNENIIYDILYMIAGAAIYSAIIYLGYRKSVIQHKRIFLYLANLKEVIEDIKIIITKEEDLLMLDKGPYKNTRQSEMKVDSNVAAIRNLMTLSDLVMTEPTDEDYNEVINLLTQLARITYREYKFLLAKSSDETKDANFLQLVSNSKEQPELHKLIFAKAVDTAIDQRELQKRFAEHVASGNVIDLGEDVIVILNDGTDLPPTGVSHINNGLEGGEIAFIISFIKKENLEAFLNNNFPQDKENE